jgi:putative colanic acid biosynthesis acetyltransferase WcaF
MTRVRQDLFDARLGLDRGRSRLVEAAWYVCKLVFFLNEIPWPSRLRVGCLRLFGAKVGCGVVIKPRTNIHLPWKLEIGDHTWIGEEAFILNFEPVRIGAHVCISQRAFLCTGNHDYRDIAMPYRNRPIVIGDGAWIGAQCFVAPGVVVGEEAVATAGSVVLKSLPPAMVCSGNPCVPLRARWPGKAEPLRP